MNNGIAQPKLITPGQVKQFGIRLMEAVPTDMLFDRADHLLKSSGGVAKLLHKALLPDNDPNRLLDAWLDMYWLIFQIEPDISKLKIPALKKNFNWLIPCFPEIPTNLVWEAHKERYPCYSYAGDDLEKAVSKDDRTYKKGPYGIWVRDRVEADEEFKDLSANVLRKRSVLGITLDERLRLELFYWVRSRGQHLDTKNITLCAGSRHSLGRVPHVYWDDGRLRVRWYFPVNANPHLRSREVVSR